MPSQSAELRFKIEAYTPQTIPMARLAEYMAHLARIFGETRMVHFVRVEGGSTVLVSTVEMEAVPKVEERLRRVRQGDAPKDAMDAFRTINQRLHEDNAKGVLLRDHDENAEIIAFLGRELEPPMTFEPFNQEGTIDGTVILIGGRKEIVPVHVIEEEKQYNCLAQRTVAKRLAEHLFTNHLRLFGTGRWYRDQAEKWVLDQFTISDFQLLSDSPLSAIVDSLRSIEGSEWKTIDDPWAELKRIRNEGDGEE